MTGQKPQPQISTLIIACNEASIIGDCLDSVVDWSDEVLVMLDSTTTDNTAQVVKKHGGTVVKGRLTNSFADRRNQLASFAHGKWLFYIDADERATPQLAEEIKAIVNFDQQSDPKLLSHSSLPKFPVPDSTTSPGSKFQIPDSNNPVAYDIPRANIRLTKPLYHGGWWPDYVLRLMRADSLKTWEGALHEQPVIEGQRGRLKNNLLHFSHRGSYEHKVKTTIKYSVTEAANMFAANHPPMTLPRFLSAIAREFWFRFVKKQGYLDGFEGILEVVYQLFSVFISYARLWELQQNSKPKSNQHA